MYDMAVNGHLNVVSTAIVWGHLATQCMLGRPSIFSQQYNFLIIEGASAGWTATNNPCWNSARSVLGHPLYKMAAFTRLQNGCWCGQSDQEVKRARLFSPLSASLPDSPCLGWRPRLQDALIPQQCQNEMSFSQPIPSWGPIMRPYLTEVSAPHVPWGIAALHCHSY